MYCFKSYLFMVVLIFVEKVASDCIGDVQMVFNNKTRFVECYKHAYTSLTLAKINDYSTKHGLGLEDYGVDYMNYIYNNVDFGRILDGSNYCMNANDQIRCEQELEKYSFSLTDKRESFQHAFKFLTRESFTANGVNDTYASGYFEDIFSKAIPDPRSYNIEIWCREETKRRSQLEAQRQARLQSQGQRRTR